MTLIFACENFMPYSDILLLVINLPPLSPPPPPPPPPPPTLGCKFQKYIDKHHSPTQGPDHALFESSQEVTQHSYYTSEDGDTDDLFSDSYSETFETGRIQRYWDLERWLQYRVANLHLIPVSFAISFSIL